MSGEAGEELDTPAARIMARRESRAAMPDRLKVAAPDDSSDEEWNGDDDEDEEEDGRVYLDASKCGRVRLHAVQGAAQSSSGLGVDDERRKSLADKGWARRTAVVNSVGASGAASFELVPGREQFGPGDDAAAEWERQMLQFTEDNFEDTGIEVRSMDKRDREIGLFGDFLERVKHGKFVEWRADPEHAGNVNENRRGHSKGKENRRGARGKPACYIPTPKPGFPQ